ncbi:hypothetical protein FR943_01560 [Mycobacterium sp. TNTM28]|uniref:Uncharacterized protein n=1 Tax=[Mycobacterium] fortunisiensis TaxID=2600579 RepID=A0ABS6KG38_9MYCO|nr:hypothetical protein [[Mycobacterium] fortunisiensis]MBU9762539.1 hypothetical protein [[Mycobacterium] fortunisiensis]
MAVGHLLGVAALAVGSMLVACSPGPASPVADAPLQAGAQTTIPVDPIGISEIEAGPNNVLYLGGSGGLSTLAPGAAQPARMNLDPQPVVSSMAVAPDGTVSFVKLGGVVETLKPGATTAEPLPFDRLRHFSKIAVARDGTVYLGDNEQHKLLKLAPGKRVPTELAVGEVDGLGHMVVDGDDNLYVSMRGKIVKIAKGATTAEPVAGVTGHAGGLAVDAAGNLYATDLQANTVSRTVTPGGDWAQLPFDGLQTPADIAVDGDGNVYVVNKLGTEIARLAAT